MSRKSSTIKEKKSNEAKPKKEYLKKYTVIKKFESFLPDTSNFEIVNEVIPELKKEQFLVKTLYISVDPYMRSFASNEIVPYDQFGFQVGVIIKSNNAMYPLGSYVVSHAGWRDHAVLDGEADSTFNITPYIPNIGGLTLSMSIGALGMTGMAAYLGLTEILKIKHKDIVCVTSAAGGVGSIAGQIAKIKGCTVIGFCGTDEKVRILSEEFGLHHVINYRTEPDIIGRLKTLAPKGINCFFDNVGGKLAEKIFDCMHQYGRVAVCGATSTYGSMKEKERYILPKTTCKIQSFSFDQWPWDKQTEAMDHLRSWIEKGDIIVRETVRVGFNCLPDALISCLKGEHIGKSLVQLEK